MAFGDKLNGGKLKNTDAKVGKKDYGNKRRLLKRTSGKSEKPKNKFQKKGIFDKRKDVKNTGRTSDEVLFPMRQGRNYSDKVFDQSKFNFKRRQKEAYEERLRKDKENASYFDRIKKMNDDGEALFKDSNISYGKYSKKLKHSRKKKTPFEEYESKYGKNRRSAINDDSMDEAERNAMLQRKKNEEYERQKIIQDKEKQKEYERKMNDRMMYEKRYKQMQEHVQEVKFFGKQASKRAEKEAKSYIAIVSALGAVFMVLYTLSAGAIGMFIGSAGGSGAGSSVTSVCWNSERSAIDNSEEYFYQKFLALKSEIQYIKDSTVCDEIQQTGFLDYDHIAFMCYLSALYNGSFTYDSSLQASMDSIFNDMFSYTYSTGTETRTESVYDATTDTWSDVDVDVTVLYININCKDFDDYATSNLNAEQKKYYDVSKSIDGGIQCFGAPSESWRNFIVNYYTLSSGTLTTTSIYGDTAYAMRDGTVTAVGTNYVKVEGSDGTAYQISGLAGVTVPVGSFVSRGQAIGMSGSSTKLSTWINGNAVNPLFYVRTN